jgi:hypothetical protein
VRPKREREKRASRPSPAPASRNHFQPVGQENIGYFLHIIDPDVRGVIAEPQPSPGSEGAHRGEFDVDPATWRELFGKPLHSWKAVPHMLDDMRHCDDIEVRVGQLAQVVTIEISDEPSFSIWESSSLEKESHERSRPK